MRSLEPIPIFFAAAVKARDQGVLENRALNMGRAMAESLARLGAFPNWLPPRRLAPSPSQAWGCGPNWPPV